MSLPLFSDLALDQPQHPAAKDMDWPDQQSEQPLGESSSSGNNINNKPSKNRPFVEIHLFKFLPSDQLEGGTFSFVSLFTPLFTVPGLETIYYGEVIETAGAATLILVWDSFASCQKFYRLERQEKKTKEAESFLRWKKYLESITEKGWEGARHAGVHPAGEQPHLAVTKALEVPCTEIVTAYGVEDAFLPQCGEFMDKVETGLDELKKEMSEDEEKKQKKKDFGYKGYFYGPTQGEIRGWDGDKGRGVVLCIGWDSKKSHIAAKEMEGSPIAENIQLIRTARQSLTMHHAKLMKIR